MARPEGVVAIAQVGEISPEHLVDQAAQQPVSATAHPCDVIAAATARKARALGEVSAGDKSADEPDDLRAVGGSVCVDRHENVTARGSESCVQRVSLAPAGL